MQNQVEIDRIVGTAYDTYAGSVRRYLTGVTHDSSAAEDLTHDAFLRLTVEVRAGRTPDDIGAWLHRVGHNLAMSRGRRMQVADRHLAELAGLRLPHHPNVRRSTARTGGSHGRTEAAATRAPAGHDPGVIRRRRAGDRAVDRAVQAPHGPFCAVPEPRCERPFSPLKPVELMTPSRRASLSSGARWPTASIEGQWSGEPARARPLAAALGSTAAGQGRTVVIGGEAGIGKSRLVGALVDHARADSAYALSGACLPTGSGAIPYAPFVEAIRELTRSMEPAGSRGCWDRPVTRSAGSCLNWRRGRPTTATGNEGTARPKGGCSKRSSPYSSAWRAQPSWSWWSRTSNGPTRARAPSPRSCRAISVMRAVLLLITIRTDEADSGGNASRFMAELERHDWVERIELRAARPDRGRRAAAARPGSSPPGDVVERSWTRTAATPSSSSSSLHPATTPRDCRRGCATCSSPDSPNSPRRRGSSCVPRRPRGGTWMTMSSARSSGCRPRPSPMPSDRPSVRVFSWKPGVERAGRAGYTFRHALLAEVAERELLHGERDRLHAAFAAELERRGAVDGIAVEPAELAYHWVAANDRGRAVPALVGAGLAAERVYAFADARRQFEQALQLWPAEEEPPGGGLDRVALLQHAAESAVLAGA